MLFEKDGWTVVSNAAQRYLRAFLFLPPDSKILEDTHNYLRDLARQGRSNMNSPQARSTAAIRSGRIEERGIVHKMPDRTYFRGHCREAEMGLMNKFIWGPRLEVSLNVFLAKLRSFLLAPQTV